MMELTGQTFADKMLERANLRKEYFDDTGNLLRVPVALRPGTWKTKQFADGLHGQAAKRDYPARIRSRASKRRFRAGLLGGMVAMGVPFTVYEVGSGG